MIMMWKIDGIKYSPVEKKSNVTIEMCGNDWATNTDVDERRNKKNASLSENELHSVAN